MRTIPWLSSRSSPIMPLLTGTEKLGQPIPESYLSSLEKRVLSHPAANVVPVYLAIPVFVVEWRFGSLPGVELGTVRGLVVVSHSSSEADFALVLQRRFRMATRKQTYQNYRILVREFICSQK